MAGPALAKVRDFASNFRAREAEGTLARPWLLTTPGAFGVGVLTIALAASMLSSSAVAGANALHLKVNSPEVVLSDSAIVISGRVAGRHLAKKGVVSLEVRKRTAWVIAARRVVDLEQEFSFHWTPPRDTASLSLRISLLEGRKRLAPPAYRRIRVQARSPATPDEGWRLPQPPPSSLDPPISPWNPPPPPSRPLNPPPAPMEFEVPGGRMVVSDGGPIALKVGDLTVEAPAGAIEKGESLSLTTGPSPTGTPAPSIANGPYYIGASQGEPSEPVKVVFEYNPAAVQTGSVPLVIHDLLGTGGWAAEATAVDPASHTASATLDSFSPIDIANSGVYYGGYITGNRADLPDDCGGTVPSWVTDVSLPDSEQQPLPICIANGSDESSLHLSLVNNRGYAQLVSLGGVDVDIHKFYFGDSLEQELALGLSAALPSGGPQTFILAPGGKAMLTIDKPSDQPAARDVFIDPRPRAGVTAFAMVAWSILATAKDKIGNPTEAVNCVMGGLAPIFSGAGSVSQGQKAIHHCADAGSGYTGVAKKAFQKLAYGLAVDDFFYKLQDLEADTLFPAMIGFTILGTGTVDSDIHISPLDLGLLPAGELTKRQLTASGGSEPYEFRISGNSANAGAVPHWVTLSKGGLLEIDPPVGTHRVVDFGVYVFDSERRHNPFSREHLRFRIGGAGGVWAWGDGRTGELGTTVPPTGDAHGPLAIDTLTGLVEVTGGPENAYALRADGTVWAWGADSGGQLGKGTAGEDCDPNYPISKSPLGETTYECSDPVPSRVQGLTDVSEIAAGYSDAYALRSDGTVWSWGSGGIERSRGPVVTGYGAEEIPGLTEITAIAASSGSAYALRADGTVLAWGDEGAGQLGIGLDESSPIVSLPGCGLFAPCYSAKPQQVLNLTNVVAITAGRGNAYALRADGEIWAWGDNNYDQVGQGGSDTGYREGGCYCFYPWPTRVQGLGAAEAIEAGWKSVYALVGGRVWAWGSNVWGQLGNGTTPNGDCNRGTGEHCDSGMPIEVAGLPRITSLAAGGGLGNQYSHVLALDVGGRVWAWGSNSSSQIDGEGSTFAVPSPHELPTLQSVVSIGAGGGTSYAVAGTP